MAFSEIEETELETVSRRDFIKTTGTALTGVALLNPVAQAFGQQSAFKKKKLALVGTGSRGIGMWGRSVAQEYGDYVEFVGLCDINPGRVKFAREAMEVNCPTFTDFEKMMQETKPDVLIVTTVDATHDEFIIKGMKMGADVISEKPMTTDEIKCQNILNTERETGKHVTVTFNYRYSPHRTKLKELLMENRVGKVTSADFHWYLDTRHGADYFRRWHRLREKSGTLLVHKATHHFDLLNWWLDSDPLEVFGNGDLEFYGKNGAFRHTHCRPCPHKEECPFYWDITRTRRRRRRPESTGQGENRGGDTNRRRWRNYNMELYVAHEQHDGYHRDGCVFREDIDIYDKMAVQIKYANNVQVSYSLTAYSPYEGYRIAFNGTKGRLEAWIHERQPWERKPYDELRVTDNFGETQLIEIPHGGGGHGGGDTRLKDKIFKDPNASDPFKQSAGTRDGAMSALIGIAARKSIEAGHKIKIADLVDIAPQAVRPL